MSVINNVLKDLENKPSAFKPLNLSAVDHGRKAKKNPGMAIWLMAPLIIAVVGSFYYVQHYSAAEASVMPTTEVSQSAADTIIRAETESTSNIEGLPPASPVVEPTPAKLPNQLVGLHINETPSFVELSFQLTESAQSFLKQRSQDRYVFMIRNSSNQISTPQIENAWLKDIQLQQDQEDVAIQFDTAEGVLVETLHEQQQQDHYWKIRLKKSIVAEKPVATETRPEPILQAAKPAATKPSATSTLITAAAKQTISPVKLQIKPAKIELTDSERLKRAISQFEAGELSASEIGLKSLLDGELDREARINLLSLYQYRKKTQQFQQLLAVSLAQYPQDMDLILIDANQLINNKQYSTLVQRYQGITKDKQLLSLVAASYQRMQQHAEAIDYYTRALELDPRQPKSWISLAISQEQQAEYNQALQSYQMAARSGPLNDRLTGFVQQRIQQLNNGAL